jgi:hypothetical protein
LKDEAAASMITHREKAQFVDENWEFSERANKSAPVLETMPFQPIYGAFRPIGLQY